MSSEQPVKAYDFPYEEWDDYLSNRWTLFTKFPQEYYIDGEVDYRARLTSTPFNLNSLKNLKSYEDGDDLPLLLGLFPDLYHIEDDLDEMGKVIFNHEFPIAFKPKLIVIIPYKEMFEDIYQEIDNYRYNPRGFYPYTSYIETIHHLEERFNVDIDKFDYYQRRYEEHLDNSSNEYWCPMSPIEDMDLNDGILHSVINKKTMRIDIKGRPVGLWDIYRLSASLIDHAIRHQLDRFPKWVMYGLGFRKVCTSGDQVGIPRMYIVGHWKDISYFCSYVLLATM